MMSASHAVYSLRLHIVFVTKYRRKTLTPAMLEVLREVFREIFSGWRCPRGGMREWFVQAWVMYSHHGLSAFDKTISQGPPSK
ncbi:transposase [Sulfobacillus thermosulfidooxidans]|uniref:transposase n=1 Tax=Sulfobacillus thermosulfidooxidans TaxID=28034 RepID=UPI000A65900F|nr:transposase [Sulfobacillus thermosulfidooxidans]